MKKRKIAIFCSLHQPPRRPGIGSILYIVGADFLLGGGLFKELIHKLTLYVMYLAFSWEWLQLSWNQLEIVKLL